MHVAQWSSTCLVCSRSPGIQSLALLTKGSQVEGGVKEPRELLLVRIKSTDSEEGSFVRSVVKRPPCSLSLEATDYSCSGTEKELSELNRIWQLHRKTASD